MLKGAFASLGSELIADDGQSARRELMDRVVVHNQRVDAELAFGGSGGVVVASRLPWLR